MISIVTYADLGTKRNLKTPQAQYLINVFKQKNELSQVICRRVGWGDSVDAESALPSSVYWVLGGLQKILGDRFSKRFYEEKVFDYFAARKLKKTNVVFFHPARFQNTVQKANELGCVTIGFGTRAHHEFNNSLYNNELIHNNIYSEKEMTDIKIDNYNVFDYLIAYSDFAKKTYIANGFPEDKIFIANPDIDTDRFISKIKSESNNFTVIFPASSIGILKGLQYLIDAWQKINLPNAKLIILGKRKGWPKDIDRKISKIIKENPSIEEKGVVSNPEDYFQLADVAVYPSLSEGFGRASLETMACGTPVIVTENSQGIVQDGETGFVLPVRDAEGIKEKLEYLYENKSKAREMGKRAARAARAKKPFGDVVYEIYQKIERE